MTKKQALFFLILILLLTAALAGLTYFLAKRRAQPEKIPWANTNAQVQDLETPALDTSDLSAEALAQEDWLTYRNEEYGFEFRHPVGWCIRGHDCSISDNRKEIDIEFGGSISSIGPGVNDPYYNFQQSSKDSKSEIVGDMEVYKNFYHLDFPPGGFLKSVVFSPKLSKRIKLHITFLLNDRVFSWPEDKKLITQTIDNLKNDTIYPEKIRIFDQIISTLKKI